MIGRIYSRLAAALIVMIVCETQAAENNSFELVINNKCNDPIKVQVYSKETSSALVTEQVIGSGEAAHMVVDPAIAGDVQVTNLRTDGEIRIYMNNVLQDRQNSSAVAITIENANFSADTPKAVDIRW